MLAGSTGGVAACRVTRLPPENHGARASGLYPSLTIRPAPDNCSSLPGIPRRGPCNWHSRIAVK